MLLHRIVLSYGRISTKQLRFSVSGWMYSRRTTWILRQRLDVFAPRNLDLASAVGRICDKKVRFSFSGWMYLRQTTYIYLHRLDVFAPRNLDLVSAVGCVYAEQPRYHQRNLVYLHHPLKGIRCVTPLE